MPAAKWLAIEISYIILIFIIMNEWLSENNHYHIEYDND